MKAEVAELLRTGAVFSPCERYRYGLARGLGQLELHAPAGTLAFVMLNPSTADAAQDDPTIRRCIGYGKSWGHDRVLVANLFAYRSTDPEVLGQITEPEGDDNDRWILAIAKHAQRVVCAWGVGASGRAFRDLVRKRAADVRAMLQDAQVPLHYLAMTKGEHGQPGHPLYLDKRLQPTPWR